MASLKKWEITVPDWARKIKLAVQDWLEIKYMLKFLRYIDSLNYKTWVYTTCWGVYGMLDWSRLRKWKLY